MRIWILTTIALALAWPLQAQRLDLSTGLEKLAANASEKVEIDLDASMLGFAAKILSDENPEELAAKKLVTGLQGIYVRRYTFAADGQFNLNDIKPIQDQLNVSANPCWTRVIATTANAGLDGSGPKKKPPRPVPNDEVTELWLCAQSPEKTRKVGGDGEKTSVDLVKGMLVIATTAKEVTIVNIVGAIRPEDFSELGGRFGIPKINLQLKKEDQE